jgi:hypothetical protein
VIVGARDLTPAISTADLDLYDVLAAIADLAEKIEILTAILGTSPVEADPLRRVTPLEWRMMNRAQRASYNRAWSKAEKQKEERHG